MLRALWEAANIPILSSFGFTRSGSNPRPTTHAANSQANY